MLYPKLLIGFSPKKFLKRYGPFLWMGFNCHKTTEPQWGESLFFTTKSPGVPGTHLINLGMMKSWVDLALQPSNLLHKLKFDGISGWICNLISSLLNHTHLRMVLDGKSLQGYLGNAGVSQSSILGPSHFRYALLTFLVMLSLVLLSMSLMILLCTLSVSKHIIYGNI